MEKITYVDPETFEEFEQEFEELHFDIAESIKDSLRDTFKHIATVTKILSNKEGDKLMIALLKNRKPGDENAKKYKITIEKFV